MKWFTISGLVLDVIGAIFLVYSLIISTKKAIELGVSRWSDETDEENLKLPQVKDRLKQSKNAAVGLSLIVLGFISQIIGNWPR